MLKLTFGLLAVCVVVLTNNVASAQDVTSSRDGKTITSVGLKYYSAAPESVELWNYEYKAYTGKSADSVQPVGLLVLWRTKPVLDSEYFNTYKSFPRPSFQFVIYDRKDSVYCLKESMKTLIISNCVPPNVGGDLVTIGNIFL